MFSRKGKKILQPSILKEDQDVKRSRFIYGENDKFDGEELDRIARRLERYHSIFYYLYKFGKPIFSDKVTSAGISFDRKGKMLNFLINREFWNSQSDIQREFILAHECIHCIYLHPLRMTGLIDDKTRFTIANFAADLVTNELLIEHFGFLRKFIDPTNRYCWLDKFYKKEELSEKRDKSFEYYYADLMKNVKTIEIGKLGETVDDHSMFGMSKEEAKEFGEKMKDFIEDYAQNAPCKDLESLDRIINGNENSSNKTHKQSSGNPEIDKESYELIKSNSDLQPNSIQAGIHEGHLKKIEEYRIIHRKKKWATIFAKSAKTLFFDEVNSQWKKTNRRLMTMGDKLILPSENEFENKSKITICMFLDTSGSCTHLSEKFFDLACSIPSDKFNVLLHCFDTRVYKTDFISRKLYGFGGTSFTCIEDYIQQNLTKDYSTYPKAVLVITDGYGNKVNPLYPSRWYWVLSEDYKDCIPQTSKIFSLNEFD